MPTLPSLLSTLSLLSIFPYTLLAACPKVFTIKAPNDIGGYADYPIAKPIGGQPTDGFNIGYIDYPPTASNGPHYFTITNSKLYANGTSIYANLQTTGPITDPKYVFFASDTWKKANPDLVKSNKIRALTAELEPSSCELLLEFEDYVFHGANRRAWLMKQTQFVDGTGFYRWVKLIAVPSGG